MRVVPKAKWLNYLLVLTNTNANTNTNTNTNTEWNEGGTKSEVVELPSRSHPLQCHPPPLLCLLPPSGI